MQVQRGTWWFLFIAAISHQTAVLHSLFPTSLRHWIFSETYQVVNDTNGCTTMLRTFNPLIHKPKYRVGVFSSEGDDVAYRQYNLTFAQYLTATAGRRFNPPIHFEMVPVTLTSLMEMGKEEEVDFSFASSAVSSCMATEQKVQPLVTVINRRQSRGHTYELDQYGGVIATLATNKHINNMEDLKDKTIGAGTITAMGGGQTQFHEMSLYGLSFVADPKQMVFTNDERLTVPGLLNGDFEVAFVRTDQIERHRDSNGKIVDQGTCRACRRSRAFIIVLVVAVPYDLLFLTLVPAFYATVLVIPQICSRSLMRRPMFNKTELSFHSFLPPVSTPNGPWLLSTTFPATCRKKSRRLFFLCVITRNQWNSAATQYVKRPQKSPNLLCKPRRLAFMLDSEPPDRTFQSEPSRKGLVYFERTRTKCCVVFGETTCTTTSIVQRGTSSFLSRIFIGRVTSWRWNARMDTHATANRALQHSSACSSLIRLTLSL